MKKFSALIFLALFGCASHDEVRANYGTPLSTHVYKHSKTNEPLRVQEFADKAVLLYQKQELVLARDGKKFVGENIEFGFLSEVAVLRENGIESVFYKE